MKTKHHLPSEDQAMASKDEIRCPSALSGVTLPTLSTTDPNTLPVEFSTNKEHLYQSTLVSKSTPYSGHGASSNHPIIHIAQAKPFTGNQDLEKLQVPTHFYRRKLIYPIIAASVSHCFCRMSTLLQVQHELVRPGQGPLTLHYDDVPYYGSSFEVFRKTEVSEQRGIFGVWRGLAGHIVQIVIQEAGYVIGNRVIDWAIERVIWTIARRVLLKLVNGGLVGRLMWMMYKLLSVLGMRKKYQGYLGTDLLNAIHGSLIEHGLEIGIEMVKYDIIDWAITYSIVKMETDVVGLIWRKPKPPRVNCTEYDTMRNNSNTGLEHNDYEDKQLIKHTERLETTSKDEESDTPNFTTFEIVGKQKYKSYFDVYKEAWEWSCSQDHFNGKSPYREPEPKEKNRRKRKNKSQHSEKDRIPEPTPDPWSIQPTAGEYYFKYFDTLLLQLFKIDLHTNSLWKLHGNIIVFLKTVCTGFIPYAMAHAFRVMLRGEIARLLKPYFFDQRLIPSLSSQKAEQGPSRKPLIPSQTSTRCTKSDSKEYGSADDVERRMSSVLMYMSNVQRGGLAEPFTAGKNVGLGAYEVINNVSLHSGQHCFGLGWQLYAKALGLGGISDGKSIDKWKKISDELSKQKNTEITWNDKSESIHKVIGSCLRDLGNTGFQSLFWYLKASCRMSSAKQLTHTSRLESVSLVSNDLVSLYSLGNLSLMSCILQMLRICVQRHSFLFDVLVDGVILNFLTYPLMSLSKRMVVVNMWKIPANKPEDQKKLETTDIGKGGIDNQVLDDENNISEDEGTDGYKSWKEAMKSIVRLEGANSLWSGFNTEVIHAIMKAFIIRGLEAVFG